MTWVVSRLETRCARCFVPGLNLGAGEAHTLRTGKPLLDPDQRVPTRASYVPKLKLSSPRASLVFSWRQVAALPRLGFWRE